MVKPRSKVIRAYINKPVEDMLKVRAVQIGVSKEVLVGHILTEFCSKAHTQSDYFKRIQQDLA